MNARPLKGLPRSEAGTDRFEKLRIRPNLRVAAHARLRGRKTGKRGCLDQSVAIAAIDAVIAYVVLMAEFDWLHRRDLYRGRPRAPVCNVGHGDG